jgi:hypothetical protein
MRVSESVEVDAAVRAPDVETEFTVEACGLVEVWNGEREVIQRMNRRSGGPCGRLWHHSSSPDVCLRIISEPGNAPLGWAFERGLRVEFTLEKVVAISC